MATLGRRQFSVTEDRFEDYLAEIAAEARAGEAAVRPARHSRRRGDAESHPQQEELAHRRAQHPRVHQRRSAGRGHPARDPAAGRAQHRVPSASSDDARGSRSGRAICGTTASALAELVDVWEAANRDDLFSVTSLKHYPVRREQRLPQAEAPLLVEDAAAMREELGRRSRARCARTSTSRSRCIATASWAA